MNSLLLLACLTTTQADYFPARYTYTYRSTGPYFTFQRPTYYYWYSTPRRYKNRKRYVAPDHRKKRLEWERSRLSEQGRHDQLRSAVRKLWMNEVEYSESLRYALDNLNDYDTLRLAVLEYKRLSRKNDPNWGRRIE